MQQGRVRLEDQLGKTEADTAADFGRRHQSEVLIDARRVLLTVRCHWYPVMLQLHRYGCLSDSIMMGEVVLLLIPLFGIRVVRKKYASLIFGSMLILPLFLALLVS